MHLTLYPEVNSVLNTLLTGIHVALTNQFVGLYLYGSLASGGFNPETSDIDFAVVTAEKLTRTEIAALETLHSHLAASGGKWAQKLEGSYLARRALRRYDPADATPWPTLNEGRFYLAPHGWDWVIQRHILREQGVVVAGPPLLPMIDPVAPDDLRLAVRELLKTWWTPMIEQPARLRGSDYQAYAILSMCRALYTLHSGDIPSKPAAARWAQQALGESWAGLIDRALAWRQSEQMDSLPEVIELIQYTLAYSQQS